MITIDHTHNIAANSWVESANAPEQDFPIQNLPFAVFRPGSNGAFRGGVAIGAEIVDLAALARTDALSGLAAAAARACAEPTLDDFFAMGRGAWQALRHALFALLHRDVRAASDSSAFEAIAASLSPQSEAEYALPVSIGDYTDFYTSIHHARAVAKLFKAGGTLPPNFQWLPQAYHGRASSVGVSGQRVRRPHGQVLAAGETTPRYVPTERLDYELELGIFVGRGNALGERIDVGSAEDRAFGLCLLNDWSARDVQIWESLPLGPFQAKNFATTISPWVVTLEALAPYRLPWRRDANEPQPLAHLDAPSVREHGALDIELEVSIETARMRAGRQPPARLSRTNFKHQYWTIAQMIAHHAANGCNLQPGDLIGTGTISGPLPEEAGAMIELSFAGAKPVILENGESRSFLCDGDAIVTTAWCARAGYNRIGFGRNYGLVTPAA